jgi:hypothetical protein
MPMSEPLPPLGSTSWYPWASEIHNDVNAISDSWPRGTLGYAERLTTTAAMSTIVDVTGMSVTFTAQTGRLYKVTVHIPEAIQATASGIQQVYIRDAANTILNRSVRNTPSTTATLSHHVTWVGTLSAGTQTMKVSAAVSAGTFSFSGAATVRNVIVVEDIGAA